MTAYRLRWWLLGVLAGFGLALVLLAPEEET